MPDSSVATTTYQSGNNVVQTDALGRQTTYSSSAAGHPDAGVLMSVTDPANVTTTYAYERTRVVGRFAARAIPYAGWAMLAWDAYQIGRCAY